MADGFFLVFVSSEDDYAYAYALFEGPWMIADNPKMEANVPPEFVLK